MIGRNYLTPSETVYKPYLRSYVSKKDLCNFACAMNEFFQNYNLEEHEEHDKLYVREFLKEAFYHGTNAINTYGDTDSAIYSNVHARSSVPVVLIEAKHVNNTTEMCSLENINKKALHELILYYILEEVREKNIHIKNLIVTDGYHWFIFDKKVFLDNFVRDKKFARKVLDLEDAKEYNRKDIYAIIKNKVEEVKDNLVFTYFDISNFEGKLDDDSIFEDKKLKAIYKVLSPVHLLQQPFIADHNTINQKFYNELLYILGLHEKKEKNSGMRTIERLPKAQRQDYSMLEQAMQKLEDYGVKIEEEQFDIALGLVIEWINRFLFLKLLEAQLKEIDWTDFPKESRNDISLTFDKIPDYCTFYELCMRTLAKPYRERTQCLNVNFERVPYLNSSLFELSDAEKKYFSINAICQNKMQVYSQTAVKDKGRRKIGKMDSLEYLLRFLASYNYGADSLETKEADTIISASVLGLIFEKINGYKDGAFFTPGYITEYMCHETIQKAVVDKFNEVKGWQCRTFDELINSLDTFHVETRLEYNDIVNSLKICDPAVGSGHFLVTALNELIVIKYRLGILEDHIDPHKKLDSHVIDIQNGELLLTNALDEKFKYKPSSIDSSRIQRTLFEEKRTIIENCLFGVDLNQKSVDICRLRLWIELLKNAYYCNDNGEVHLQTLPNIDINIKRGNSLLSNYPIRPNTRIDSNILSEKSLKAYFANVKEFKNCKDKARKADIRMAIDAFKKSFDTNGREQCLFGRIPKKTNKKDILSEKYSHDALEWMIEFPEILTEEGNFKGFDVILGNPPYVNLQNQKELSTVYHRKINVHEGIYEPVYTTYDSKGDLYMLFVERALSLLKPIGRMSFILPNKWMKVGAGKGLRKLLSKKANLTEMIDFQDFQIFPEATTYTCIVNIMNQMPSDTLKVATIPAFNKEELKEKAEKAFATFSRQDLDENIWVTSSVAKNHLIKRLQTECISLEEYVHGNANYGIKPALTDAFIIQEEAKNQLISADKSAKEILRPMLRAKGLQAFSKAEPENYLVFLPKGFTKKGLGIAIEEPKPDEATAWKWFCEKYPSIANHLAQYEDRGRSRSDQGDYWWELRACSYYEEFSRPKIMYQRFSVQPCFIYDENGYVCNDSIWSLSVKDKRLIAVLNSKVGWWLTTELCPMISGGRSLNWDNFKLLPIPRELPDSLATLSDELIKAREDKDEGLFNAKYEELNNTVKELYGITTEL